MHQRSLAYLVFRGHVTAAIASRIAIRNIFNIARCEEVRGELFHNTVNVVVLL